MPGDGKLELNLVNVYGEPVQELVNVFLHHRTLSEHFSFYDIDASKTIAISGLSRAPQGLYQLEVDSSSYHMVNQFVNIASSGTTQLTIVLPVDPARVVAVRFPSYPELPNDAQRLLEASKSVLGFSGISGSDLYNAFDDIRRAGFLNLVCKSNQARFANSRTVLSYIQLLAEVRGDRFFAAIPPELPSETAHSVAGRLFHEVDESLHEPPSGFARARSYKTLDHYGNLQLSFFSDPNNNWMLDMDIDDAQGLEHIFQVIGNAVTQQPTHPYNIHEILVSFQHIDPGYRLLVGKAAAAAAAANG
jgi:hypothetical protein